MSDWDQKVTFHLATDMFAGGLPPPAGGVPDMVVRHVRTTGGRLPLVDALVVLLERGRGSGSTEALLGAVEFWERGGHPEKPMILVGPSGARLDIERRLADRRIHRSRCAIESLGKLEARDLAGRRPVPMLFDNSALIEVVAEACAYVERTSSTMASVERAHARLEVRVDGLEHDLERARARENDLRRQLAEALAALDEAATPNPDRTGLEPGFTPKEGRHAAQAPEDHARPRLEAAPGDG